MSSIGVDIGGTHIRGGLVSAEGQLLRRMSIQTRPERGPDATIAATIELIRDLLPDPSSVVSIGVGVSGPVDVTTGVVSNPYTLGGWPPTDLMSPLRAAFPGSTIVIDNDANAAVAGEWWAGSGRGTQRFALVTLGTGIGVGFLIGGEVQRSSRGHHGEAGHVPLDPSGPPCYCGARGCWESLASGTVLTQRLKGEVFDPTNPRHRAALQEIAHWTGLGLVTLCATFTPERIAIGGGVSQHFDLMRDTMLETLRRHRPLVPVDIPICAAEAGDDAGIIGAAFLARRSKVIHD